MSRKRSRENDLEDELNDLQRRMKVLKSSHNSEQHRLNIKRKFECDTDHVNSKRRKITHIQVPEVDLHAMGSCIQKLVEMCKTNRKLVREERVKNKRLGTDNYNLQRRVYELEQQLNFKQNREVFAHCAEPWMGIDTVRDFTRSR